jgi:hypothetical protein
MKRFLLISALLIGAASVGVSQAQNDTAIVLGPGTKSCGAWLKLQKRPAGPPPSVQQEMVRIGIKQALRSWVLGYISAYNRHVQSGGNITKNTDHEGIYAFIHDYCRKSPLHSVEWAAWALIAALDRR